MFRCAVVATCNHAPDPLRGLRGCVPVSIAILGRRPSKVAVNAPALYWNREYLP
ncbi:hypothetical protein [Microbulbifer halophilus]|uniref:hypothetical protein n=1 Tax=Microbulbifer halophilus TaxID=453963 RepID=UPI00361C77AC